MTSLLSVLERREHPGFRSDVARGRHAATEVYAYRHLAGMWAEQPHTKAGVLRVSALACDFPHIAHDAKITLGAMLARTANATKRHESFGQKLFACQQMPLDGAVQVWRTMLPAADTLRLSVDWDRLLRLAVSWDQPNLPGRTRVRRSLIDAFHTTALNPNTDTQEF